MGTPVAQGAFLVEQLRPEGEPAPPRCPATFRESPHRHSPCLSPGLLIGKVGVFAAVFTPQERPGIE